ncbi:MAG TPA: arginine repressor [Thermoanaerobaculia bacterium]|nr:arginine repressor [Thermoanaerobaculia bacterium]
MLVNTYSIGATMRRRDEMLRIIREATIRSQDELQRLLRHRGYPAAQPTVSRDLRELGVAKGPAGYVLPVAAARAEASSPSAAEEPARPERREEKLSRVVREFVLRVETASSLVVLRTPPADASPVARALDEAALPEVVGTVSGDDTIFLATRSAAAAARLTHRLRSLISTDAKPRIRSAQPRRSKRS